MRIPLIAGNWKMNTRLSEAVKLVSEMREGLDAIKGVDKLVCPPFISLSAVKDILKGSSIRLGAQNVYFEEKGAFTGEISPPMLADLCEFIIIGHSERRQYFHETGEIVNKKLKAALKFGLAPILCVGERLAENEAGNTKKVIGGQLAAALIGIAPESLSVAYEPIWAIGTGQAATGTQANETIGFIRKSLAGIYGEPAAQNIRILYGGSVTAENIAEFIAQPEIDGGLVGGASLKPDQFISITRQAAAIKSR
jgi:triosephosphate isomerase